MDNATLDAIKAIAALVIITGSLAGLWWLDQGDRMERYLGPVRDRIYGALRWAAPTLWRLLWAALLVACFAALFSGLVLTAVVGMIALFLVAEATGN